MRMFPPGGDGHKLNQRVRPSLGDHCIVGKNPQGSRQLGVVSPAGQLPGALSRDGRHKLGPWRASMIRTTTWTERSRWSDECAVAWGPRMPAVTACARLEPSLPGAMRIQRGPTAARVRAESCSGRGESSVQLSPWYEKGEGAEGPFPRFSTDRLARLGIDSPKGLRDRSRL